MEMWANDNATVAGWGSDWNARRVSGLTKAEREHVRGGGLLLIAGPEHLGVNYRMIVAIRDRFYTRMPVVETCGECGATFIPDDTYLDADGYVQTGVPPEDNDRAWEELEKLHKPNCRWVRTRAYSRDM